MKIHLDIDCTPEEARAFFGLPDVAPMQRAVMDDVQQRMLAALGAMDPEALMKTWMPTGMQGWEQAQKQFWAAMTAAGGPAKTGSGKP